MRRDRRSGKGGIAFFAQTLHHRSDLANAHELPFSLGCSDDDRDVWISRSLEDCLQRDQVRNIEVANRHLFVSPCSGILRSVSIYASTGSIAAREGDYHRY